MTKKKSDSSEEEKDLDIEPAEADDDIDADKDADVEKDDDESEDEEEDNDKDSDNDLDLDAEIEAENRRGRPDPEKAHKRIKDKDAQDEDDESEDEEDEDDKPMTRREAREFLGRQVKASQEDRAHEIARRLTGSDKEAELVTAKWRNRSFPAGLPLSEQLEEAYAITHRKKLISQRNEALRGLKNKDGVRRDGASAHREGSESPAKGKPKGMSAVDIKAIEQAGFKWNKNEARFEKKLKNGSMVVKYPGQDTRQVSAH